MALLPRYIPTAFLPLERFGAQNPTYLLAGYLRMSIDNDTGNSYVDPIVCGDLVLMRESQSKVNKVHVAYIQALGSELQLSIRKEGGEYSVTSAESIDIDIDFDLVTRAPKEMPDTFKHLETQYVTDAHESWLKQAVTKRTTDSCPRCAYLTV